MKAGPNPLQSSFISASDPEVHRLPAGATCWPQVLTAAELHRVDDPWASGTDRGVAAAGGVAEGRSTP